MTQIADYPVVHDVSLLTGDDLYLFNEGNHFRLYDKLGSRLLNVRGQAGAYFAVWAPSAERVSVVGGFNGWNPDSHHLQPQGNSGIWQGFVPGVGKGTIYKYHIVSPSGYAVNKADPFGMHHETPPKTGSIVWDLSYQWGDAGWMRERPNRDKLGAPISIYEMHLGSWRRKADDGQRWLSYRELAPLLVDYLKETGFTHVEFLPVMEHPFYGSWGYQVTGYFAPTSRYGTPQDFMYLVDLLHQNGIGVILDWVPSHFPTDEHGLIFFDGTHLFEHADPRRGMHREWNTAIPNYGRYEVQSFLISNALFWLDKYHADGLRVDAVASMLYLDYARGPGDWIPNRFGGHENLEAIDFLRRLNIEVYRSFPDVQTIAEESTSWPMVSRPTYIGGLGFGLKWDMGWMHDTLQYMGQDPVYRKYHHNELTFRMIYAFMENFCLPLSHDEVVYGKGSLLTKMPGDVWQKLANLRLLLGWQFAQPGKKLLFMGGEFGQWQEWNHDASLDWQLLNEPGHKGIQHWVCDLNRLYRQEPAMFELDHDQTGFQWLEARDADQSMYSFLRRSRDGQEIAVLCNFTPVPRHGYRIGVPRAGLWKELLNSDAHLYGGSGQGNFGGVEAEPLPSHGWPVSLPVTVPPLGMVFLKAS